MPTAEEIAAAEAKKKAEDEALAAAEAKKNEEHMIPKARFDEVNDRLKAAEKKAADLEAAETKRKESELSEVDRLKAENAREKATREAAEAKLVDERIKAAFVAEANKPLFGEGKKKFASADVAYKLADRSAVKVEGDKVTGVTEALAAIAKESPFLLEGATASGDGVGTGRRTQTKVGTPLTKEDRIKQKRSGYGSL